MRLPTASALDRAIECPASCVLPGVETTTGDNTRGTRVHAYLARAREVGKGAALAEVIDDEQRLKLEAIDLDALPAGAEGEVALAYDPDTDTTERLQLDDHRAYPHDGRRFFMTLDLVGVTEVGGVRRAFDGDFKTGVMRVRAEDAMQLRVGTLAAARLVGADEGDGLMLYLRHDGRWNPNRAHFDAFDLEETRDQLVTLRSWVRRDHELVDAGRATELVLHDGPWCTYCPALRNCPAQKALVATAAGGELEAIVEGFAELAPAQAGQAYERLLILEKLVKGAKKVLQSMARAADGLPLSGDRLLREVLQRARVVDAGVALAVVEKEYGATIADAMRGAMRLSLTAIGEAFADAGLPSAITKEAVAAIARAGGITEHQRLQFRAVARR